jgi:membrane-associated phospholipid phosphatase
VGRRTGAAAIAAVAVFVAMWLGYTQDWAWLAGVDSWFLDGLHPTGATYPSWVTAWDVFCTVLGPGAFRIAGVVFIIWLFVRRYVRAAVFMIVTVELCGLLTEVAKQLADRPRPATAFVHAYGTSFPSGHAVGVMVCVLAYLTIVLPMVPERWRTPLKVIGVVVVVLIGVGRVVLNVHHPSDVVAGWALGFAWYVLWLRVIKPLPLTRYVAEKPAARDTVT